MDKQNTEAWYFTFMQKDTKNKDKYVRIEGSYGMARAIMIDAFGEYWAFQYSKKEFLPQIKQFHLTELKI